jgi:hypothetical protein
VDEDEVVDEGGQALIEVLPDMQPGDCIVVHEPECDLEDDCTCTPLVVRGPSGKA